MHYKECFECKKLILKSQKGNYCNACRNKFAKAKERYSVKAETNKVYKKGAWKEVRESALKRAKYRCEVCNSQGILKQAEEVHHIVKVADGTNATHYDLDNLVCVCSKCHRKIEGKNKDELIEYLLHLQDI